MGKDLITQVKDMLKRIQTACPTLNIALTGRSQREKGDLPYLSSNYTATTSQIETSKETIQKGRWVDNGLDQRWEENKRNGIPRGGSPNTTVHRPHALGNQSQTAPGKERISQHAPIVCVYNVPQPEQYSTPLGDSSQSQSYQLRPSPCPLDRKDSGLKAMC